MIGDLHPYPEYKESGLPWLGRVPTHWDVRRNGRLFAQRNETGHASLPILEVSLRTGVRVRDMDDLKRKQVMSDREKYKRAKKGDIAYNMMRMWQGAVGVVPENGLVSPAYVVARPYPETEPRYFCYLFRTDVYKNEVDGFSRGIVKDRNRLYWEDFKRMPSCFPPPDEQKAIANYLDANAVKVRRFIRNRRRLIEVLNEQKQAIINRAVTRGLAPNAPLKPSGIDWLGDVPGHWRIGRVKTEMDNLNTRRIPLNATERGKMTLRKYDYYGASGVIDKVDEYLFDDELLLIAEDGANLVLRNLPLAIIARGKFWVNNHAHILKPKRGSLEYFAALLECIDYLPWISGAAQPKLTQDRLMAVRLPVPPENEQREIADWIVANTGDLSAAIDKAKREIDLIREYRERMVSDVVTGKLEVCGLAPTEPLSAAEPIDDEEMLGDDESELVEEAADELD
jgi:type I restriction enzyme S subunit